MMDNISTLNRIINSLKQVQNSFQSRIALQVDIVCLIDIIIEQEKRINELERLNSENWGT